VRVLIFHVDAFTCTITEKGRSALVEIPTAPSLRMGEGLLVLASVEAGDETAPAEVAKGTATEVKRLARQLKAREIMVLPFAHLFGDPAPPGPALEIIDAVAADLRAGKLVVQRPPFGWFHRWDLRAKGHPMSRVARTIRPSGAGEPG
jgi:threonyl-tRNA synthetase